jgi:tetratricopeptide (TPR) repeat protein
MFRKSVILFFSVTALAFAGGVSVMAQHAPVNGTVEMLKADGTRVPVAGALIEIYRVDIKGGFPSTKTGAKGEFALAGMPLGGTYTFAVSAPGASPAIVPNIKAGQDKLLITMTPGTGAKYTEEQARQGGVLAATGGQLTEEQKKAQAEYEAKVKDVTVKNEKILKTNEIIAASLKAGNDAYVAKNYDLAVVKYDEGIAADPDYVGSAPTFYLNRGIVLVARAVDTHNKTIRSADPNERVEGGNRVRQDLAKAVDGYSKAWVLLKNAPATELPAADSQTRRLALLKSAADAFQKAIRTERIDPTLVEAAKVLIPESIAAESDPAKKAEFQTMLGDIYRVNADFDNAIAEYRKAIEILKDSPDALAGLGLSLVNVGIIAKDEGDQKKDKALADKGTAQMQEGLNLLGVFTQVAPDSHPLKASVKETTEYMAAQNKLTPQKVNTPPKKRP